MQLGIAILLPDDVHNAMRRWQLAVADLCGANAALKVHPHITLKQPFHAGALGPIEDYFDRLTEQVKPVEIVLDGAGRFEDDEVVFLAVTLEEMDWHISPAERKLLPTPGSPAMPEILLLGLRFST